MDEEITRGETPQITWGEAPQITRGEAPQITMFVSETDIKRFANTSAKEFAKQKRRMCNHFTACHTCPVMLNFPMINYCYQCAIGSNKNNQNWDEKFIAVVMKWAERNPEKTRQSEFLKMFPNAELGKNGVLFITPCDLDSSYGTEENKVNCCKGKTCEDCRREYWLAPIENED